LIRVRTVLLSKKIIKFFLQMTRSELVADRKPKSAAPGCNQRWLRCPARIALNVALRLHLLAIRIGRLASTAFARARDEGGVSISH
jgi:hypothetical protein